MTTKDEVVSS